MSAGIFIAELLEYPAEHLLGEFRIRLVRVPRFMDDGPLAPIRSMEKIMNRIWLSAFFIFACCGPLSAQQPSVPTAGLEIDLPEVVAEVKAAYDRYNEAINSGNIAVLNATFRNDPRTIRYGQAENLYGYKEIEGFRATAQALNPPRSLSRTVITTYGRDFAVASTLTHRANQPGRIGRQMQTWVRFPEGWRVVAAQVSGIDAPK
jgi:hypothetical protein